MDDNKSLSIPAGSKVPMILLKTRSQPDDSYEELFSQPGSNYDPIFVPVLQHRPNLDSLSRVRDLLLNAKWGRDQSSFGGLIFTSQRAVESFASVVHDLEAAPDKPLAFTSETPLYTVGPATSRSLRTLISSSKALAKAPVLGADTGNGEKLAHYILDHYNSLYASPGSSKPPLLFIVGEQRRDVIPKTLMSPNLPETQRIQVEELAVYETVVMDSFAKDFAKTLDAIKSKSLACIVVFSPSGCEAMLRHLDYIDESARPTGNVDRRWTEGEKRYFCVATIGPTTRNHLKERFGVEPDVCADKPSPAGILAGVTEFLRAKGVFNEQP
ncbi:MAG: hypothetical protein Q9160_004586 [Pyrenula sp. 1 TL-2023]